MKCEANIMMNVVLLLFMFHILGFSLSLTETFLRTPFVDVLIV